MLNLFLRHVVQFCGLPAAVLSLTWWGYTIAEVQPDRSIAGWTAIGIGVLVIGEVIAFRLKSSVSLAALISVCAFIVVGLPWYVIAEDPAVIPTMRSHQLDYGGVLLVLFFFMAFTVPIRWFKNGYTGLDLTERMNNLPRGSLSRALKRAAGDE